MHTSELFRPYVSAENSFNQATPIEAKLVRATQSDTKLQVEGMSYAPLFLVPLCFMVVWAIVVIIVSVGCKVAQRKDGLVTIDRFQQIPCMNCRFFDSNRYLKCAVHPSTALTRQAVNCSDYWPQ